MDRNQIIGLLLIFGLLTVYFQFFAAKPENKKKNQKTEQHEIEVKNDSLSTPMDTAAYSGSFNELLQGKEKIYVLENEDIKIEFTNKGGKIKSAELKKYKTYDQEALMLIDTLHHQMHYEVEREEGKIDLYQLFYQAKITGKKIEFSVQLGEDQYIRQTYQLPSEGFLLDYKVSIQDEGLQNQPGTWVWKAAMPKTEKDIALSRQKSTINYYETEDGFDYLSTRASGEVKENITQPIKWMAFKQQFFLIAILNKEGHAFSTSAFKTYADEKDTSIVKHFEAELSIPSDHLADNQYEIYLGPNKYNVLTNYDDKFSKNVDLGWVLFRWCNKFIIIPIFNLFEGLIDNYGLIIILLVLIIKTALFPLTYKSYVSMAKTRVLKPELDAIKEKTGGDMQKTQAAQMELYKKVGVNPLSGCIPMLLQMPILFAMFMFFPNAIELRQESFLWAEDLSTYDSIVNLPFKIPFYGSHVSLFTLLMTITTILSTWLNGQNNTAQGPVKYMGYFMPVIFMFVLNSYPSGLSFYYFCSNVITIGQQLIIRKFVDEEKIKRILERNKIANKNKKKSGFQQRLEEAMKTRAEKSSKKRV